MFFIADSCIIQPSNDGQGYIGDDYLGNEHMCDSASNVMSKPMNGILHIFSMFFDVGLRYCMKFNWHGLQVDDFYFVNSL